MIPVAALIAALEARGIFLALADGKLTYRAPRGALDAADKDALRQRRGEVMAWLKARDAGKGLRTIAGGPGPLTASIVQEMWNRFAGPPDEGKPIALNIGVASHFPGTDPDTLESAIRTVLAHHDTLRTHIDIEDEALRLSLNPAEAFVVERVASDDAPAALAQAQDYCTLLNPVEGEWLTRACIWAVPDGAVAAVSSSHIVSDAASRNLILEDIQSVLDTGAPGPTTLAYNEFSLAERDFLNSEQGEDLITWWRSWYEATPTLLTPGDRVPMLWGPGVRVLRNFVLPRRVLDKGRAVAAAMNATPFLLYLTIFCIALARWSRRADFPIRILGDKRTTAEIARTVGLMYCADAVDIHAPVAQDFETILHGILKAYDAAIALRVPTLHYYVPHCVRPGIEAPDFPNRIPAVFNYYAAGTARERRDSEAAPDSTAVLPWPPQIQRPPPQLWTRRQAPVFLHLMDQGTQGVASLHFNETVVSPADQEAFVALLFEIFADIVPVA